MTHNATFAVTRGVNCTADWARGAGEARRCEWEPRRYAMGLVVHPYLDPIGADAAQRARIFELVRAAAGPAARAATNFNKTVVMNYTTGLSGLQLPIGRSGYLGFTPLLRCFDGTLAGCGGGGDDDDDPVRDGTAILACGYVVRSRGPGPVQYSGVETFVETTSLSDEDPRPPYEDVAGNATAHRDGSSQDEGVEDEGDDESSAVRLGATFSALMAAAVSLVVFF